MSLFREWELLQDASDFDYKLVDTVTLRRMKELAKRACHQAYNTGGNRMRLLEEMARWGLDAINLELLTRA